MSMRYASLPSGVLIAVRYRPSGIEIIAQEGLSAGTVARAVADALIDEQQDGTYRALPDDCGRLPVASRRAS